MIYVFTGEDNRFIEDCCYSMLPSHNQEVVVRFNTTEDKIVLLNIEEGVILLSYPETKLSARKQFKILDCFLDYKDKNFYVITHSDHLLNSISLAVAKGNLQLTEFKIYHNKTEIQLDSNGFLVEDVEGYCDTYHLYLKELFNLRKIKNENHN